VWEKWRLLPAVTQVSTVANSDLGTAFDDRSRSLRRAELRTHSCAASPFLHHELKHEGTFQEGAQWWWAHAAPRRQAAPGTASGFALPAAPRMLNRIAHTESLAACRELPRLGHFLRGPLDTDKEGYAACSSSRGGNKLNSPLSNHAIYLKV